MRVDSGCLRDFGEDIVYDREDKNSFCKPYTQPSRQVAMRMFRQRDCACTSGEFETRVFIMKYWKPVRP
ncbi:hypothetical protein AC249_AIPGENE21852 [Exaiptasia diaphana]|nr:hypothetical protein AC249_AIPGENE21852 [Exaiptasia diaphana]